MSSEKRKQIRAERARAASDRIRSTESGLNAALALSEGLLATNQGLLEEFRADALEHGKCPRRIEALHRESLAKTDEINGLKIELALAKDNEAHWREQASAKQVELGVLQQEIVPLRNDAKSGEIARLKNKLHTTQQLLADARTALAAAE
jgi:hypothetical protein